MVPFLPVAQVIFSPHTVSELFLDESAANDAAYTVIVEI